MKDFKIVNVHPHDSKLWTQGFQYDDGFLYESHGQIGKSGIRKYAPSSQKKAFKIKLPDYYYAEGLTIVDNRLFVLTLQSKIGLIFNKSLKYLDHFEYQTNGWGLTNDSKHLIKSDGSSEIQFIDIHSFKVKKNITVCDDNEKIININEMEYVDGYIYANVLTGKYSKKIIKFDSNSGAIVDTIDVHRLIEYESDRINGIAFNNQKDTFFITGKEWKSNL